MFPGREPPPPPAGPPPTAVLRAGNYWLINSCMGSSCTALFFYCEGVCLVLASVRQDPRHLCGVLRKALSMHNGYVVKQIPYPGAEFKDWNFGNDQLQAKCQYPSEEQTWVMCDYLGQLIRAKDLCVSSCDELDEFKLALSDRTRSLVLQKILKELKRLVAEFPDCCHWSKAMRR